MTPHEWALSLARLVTLLVERGKRMRKVYDAALAYAAAITAPAPSTNHAEWLALRTAALEAHGLEPREAGPG